jgi:hypothetical protein
MKPLTLNQKRLAVGIWLAAFLFGVANEYLGWGVFGGSAKGVRLGTMFVGLVALFRFGPKLFEEIDAHAAARRESEDAAERARDKSNDVAESERLRRAIGMPPNLLAGAHA